MGDARSTTPSESLFDRLGLWLCRRGFHALMEPGNCPRCGYRYHGGHVGPYAEWVRDGRVG